MKIYLSFPMTFAESSDHLLRRAVQEATVRDFPEVSFYDPTLQDQSHLTMDQIQTEDFRAVAESDGVLMTWSPASKVSCGQHAEAEWARRVFGRPVVVFQHPGLHVPPWVVATVGGDKNCFLNLHVAVRALIEKIESSLKEDVVHA